jgi:flavin-dependent dehydrogenase
MRIGIIGGGPGGSLCATLLGQAGAEVLLFDYRGVWEKPCGGGVTYKALLRYPFLEECLEPKRRIQQIRVTSPHDAQVTVPLQDPLLVYSRGVLNRILLERAVAHRACFREERVLNFERQASHWHILTERNRYKVDFLVGADGVNSFVRKKMSLRLSADDLMMTFGYRVCGRGQDTIEVKFFPDLLGYLWVFARPDNISFGICAKLSQNPTQVLKDYLHQFLRQNYPAIRIDGHSSADQEGSEGSSAKGGCRGLPCETYSALIPSLRSRTLHQNVVSGEGWALLGDAAGFADPITCEGIYYALRSGELLAEALCQSRPGSYRQACEADFVGDFVHAADLFEKFYRGRLLGSDFITRSVQTASRSKIVQALMNSFVAGRQDYRSLKSKLVWHLPGICLQVMRSAFV